MQRKRGMWTHTITIVREVALAGGYTASLWPNVSTEISILLDQRVEDAMGQFTQQYSEVTAGIPIVYHTILRTDYHDRADAAFYKLPGKIALFHTMQAQPPPKAALKDTSKVTHAISLVDDTPGMYAGGIAYPARDPFPNLTQEEVQKDH